MIEVTLEKGKIRRFTKKFKYEKKTPEREILIKLSNVSLARSNLDQQQFTSIS